MYKAYHKGGKGVKAPYTTKMKRIASNLEPLINELNEAYKLAINHSGLPEGEKVIKRLTQAIMISNIESSQLDNETKSRCIQKATNNDLPQDGDKVVIIGYLSVNMKWAINRIFEVVGIHEGIAILYDESTDLTHKWSADSLKIVRIDL